MSHASPELPNAPRHYGPPERFMRLAEVMNVTGLSRSHIYRLMKRKAFPSTVALGPSTVAWRQTQIDAWIRGKIESNVRDPAAG